MANRLNVANIGYNDATDALTIDSSGNVTLAGNLSAPNFVGMIAAFAMTSPPDGWLACDGSPVSKTTYSALFTALGANAWGTDTTDDFYLPDLEGAFLRGTGSHGTQNMADGNDYAGPSVGSFENDQFQGHKHTIAYANNAAGGVSDALVRANSVTSYTVSFTGDTPVTGTAGTVRQGDETRPFNAGVKYCIKY